MNIPVDTLACVTFLLPAAAVRKLQVSVTTWLPKSDDWREEGIKATIEVVKCNLKVIILNLLEFTVVT